MRTPDLYYNCKQPFYFNDLYKEINYKDPYQGRFPGVQVSYKLEALQPTMMIRTGVLTMAVPFQGVLVALFGKTQYVTTHTSKSSS